MGCDCPPNMYGKALLTEPVLILCSHIVVVKGDEKLMTANWREAFSSGWLHTGRERERISPGYIGVWSFLKSSELLCSPPPVQLPFGTSVKKNLLRSTLTQILTRSESVRRQREPHAEFPRPVKTAGGPRRLNHGEAEMQR